MPRIRRKMFKKELDAAIKACVAAGATRSELDDVIQKMRLAVSEMSVAKRRHDFGHQVEFTACLARFCCSPDASLYTEQRQFAEANMMGDHVIAAIDAVQVLAQKLDFNMSPSVDASAHETFKAVVRYADPRLANWLAAAEAIAW